MESQHQLSHGGAGSDPAQGAGTQPGHLPAAVRFPYVEAELAVKLGVDAKKLAAVRRELFVDEDWARVARVIRWSEAGFQKLTAALGLAVAASEVAGASEPAVSEKSAPTVTGGARERVLVTNLNFPNQSLVLGKTAAGVPMRVMINPQWRPLFRCGMWIEAEQGSSGVWRTRRPRGVGRF